MSLPDLTPQVKGPLAEQEAAILTLLQTEGTIYKWRSTISIDPTLALAAVRAAALVKRDFSNFVSIALLDHCRQYAPPAPELAEFIAKLTAAYAASPRVLARCQSVVLKELRLKKEAA